MKQVAWKTGTSYGGRDAWAIGVTPRYVVGVWVGNATGEGRSGLTGVGYAAPILFDIYSLLPDVHIRHPEGVRKVASEPAPYHDPGLPGEPGTDEEDEQGRTDGPAENAE